MIGPGLTDLSKVYFAKLFQLLLDKRLWVNFLSKMYFFLWDDEPHVSGEYQTIIEDNYQKALKYWTFQDSEIAQITDLLQ